MAIPARYEKLVAAAVAASAAAGVPGAFSFGADIAGLATIWGGLMVAVANRSGHELDKPYAVKIAGSVLASVAGYMAGIKMATGLFHLIPGAGTLTAVGISTSLNMLFTYRFGKLLVERFDKPDIDLSGLVSDLAHDLFRVLSLGSLVSDGKEALELATTLGTELPGSIEDFALKHPTFTEFIRRR